MTKARHDGAAYVYSLLTGYDKPMPRRAMRCRPGLNYNPYFHLNLAMAPPLERRSGDLCRRHQGDRRPDGEGRRRLPELDRRAQAGSRRQTGVAAMIFLAILSVLAYLTYLASGRA